LGEAGARSLFRTILRGLKCFVAMRDCSYPEDDSIYNHAFPSALNPFVLDLSEPYKRAVFLELLFKFQQDSLHCYFENITFRDQSPNGSSSKGGEISISLIVTPTGVALKGSTENYQAPKTGIVKFTYRQEMVVPTLDLHMPHSSFFVLQIIIENGRTEKDKKMWLRLLCQDAYFLSTQVNSMIERFKKSNTIGEGGLTVLDILQS
jgi:hypothetical protein